MDTTSPVQTILAWLIQHKKWLVLIAVSIVGGVLLLGFFLPTNTPSEPTDVLPSPTGRTSLNQYETIPTQNAVKTDSKIVKNPHWLTNTELAYTYYDNQALQTIVAKTDRQNETVLSREITIKFADFYWSSNNLLLIHELSSPSKAYLFTDNSTIVNLNIRGLAYSWSPTGDEFFYVNRGNGSQFLPAYYLVGTKVSSPATIPSVDFTHTLWSPAGEQLVLYTKGFDVQDANPYLLNRTTNELLPINTNAFYSPAWSPSGTKLSYVNNEGIMVRSAIGGETLYYKTPSPQTITYTWINDEELFLIDSTRGETRKLILSLSQRKTEDIFTNLTLSPDQRIELALSPDKRTLALATEKKWSPVPHTSIMLSWHKA